MRSASAPRLALALAALLVSAPAPAAENVSVNKVVEADGTHTLVHEVVVEAPAAAVWEAISTAQGWKGWAVPVAWTDAAEPDLLETSYDPSARPGDPGTIRQQFLARIPGRLLVFRTVKAPARFPHWEDYRHVVSVFELEPAGPGRTRVRLTGAGYPANAGGKALVGFFEAGNRASLESLRRRFVEGPADWTKRLGAAAKQAR